SLERLLTDDVISVSDGGGEVQAALKTVKGRDKVIRLIEGVSRKLQMPPRASIVTLNGAPAVLFEDVVSSSTRATRYTVHITLDPHGRINRLETVLAPSKLAALDHIGLR